MRRSTFSFVLACAAAVTIGATSSTAYAGDTSTAENLFAEGMKAMQREDYAAACAAFAGSDQADPSPGTEINLALCNEKQGKLATAWGWYRTAAGLADQRGQHDRAERARGEAARIEPMVPKIRLTTKDAPSALKIVRDGTVVPSATIGIDTPIDAGSHVFEASSDGKKPWKGTVNVPAAPGSTTLDIPALEDAPTAAPVGPAPVNGNVTEPPSEAPTSDGKTQRLIGYIVGGAGVVVAGSALAWQLVALSEDDKRAELDKQLANLRADDPAREPLLTSRKSHADAAKTDQTIAIVSVVGGAALIGTGVVLVLTAPSGKKAASATRPLVYPMLGSGFAGAGLSTSF